MSEAPRGETEAEFIVRQMTELGFVPSGSFDASRVSFSKDYADPAGRRARVYVYFDKPILGFESMRLANLVLSTQVTFGPTIEEVTSEAPEPIQPDLVALLQAFAHLTVVPAQAVAGRACLKCKKVSADYYIVNDDAICHACVEARKASR